MPGQCNVHGFGLGWVGGFQEMLTGVCHLAISDPRRRDVDFGRWRVWGFGPFRTVVPFMICLSALPWDKARGSDVNAFPGVLPMKESLGLSLSMMEYPIQPT